MADYLLIVPLFLAVAAGWWLGRREAGVRAMAREQALSRDYLTGLDHLVDERTDDAIESFIRALEFKPESLTAHLALAKLLRKKGDVERAIKLHQGLLDRPGLAPNDRLRVQMAQARDYDAVGLLDRAEVLLQEVIDSSPPAEMRIEALQLLVKLYEKEGEWQRALEVAASLDRDCRKDIRHELAHYCCELAEHQLRHAGYDAAEDWLKRALKHDPQAVRASLLQAGVRIARQQWRPAIQALQQVVEQDPLFVSEILQPLQQCYRGLDREDDYQNSLRGLMARAPSTSLILALAEQIRDTRGVYAAGAFITAELKRRPSIRGFNRLIDMHIEHGARSARDSLEVLHGLTDQLEQSKPRYRCDQCGFAGRLLLWQCPSCRQWGSTRPIQGLEGE
ncbi:lipopolysaccharide assembly protein B [Marinobacterium nitratireducens]|uniref:Lipopolysaccharide assembly protein B n=1 Tax=Marinobacterium nitratireducens TaxID=518897 RepID=A0A917ZH26_9GAMM|nr:lipopolysaccharide assembly protein LapB [Marinobacterium nitratireducens]GGO82643.1 lipopolysaccharide assembly protein B [Marinobacterium nitratireducens]